MGRWEPDWPYPPPSRPRRVEGGIKARSRRGQIGESWWSERFLAVLESFGMEARLRRGRAYARAGQVLELTVAPGVVRARVQGSRVRPYRVEIGVKTLPEQDWARVEQAMAGQALFAAKLLAGEMPREIEQAFGACRLSLFPAAARDLASSCSCPDWANPCKHIAAVYYLLAEAFDADPFLIFAWRGRAKDELLEHLRALRGGTAAAAAAGQEDHAAIAAIQVDEPPLAASLAAGLEAFWMPAAGQGARPGAAGQRPGSGPPGHRPGPAAPADLLLRQLDPPAVEVRGRSLAALLAPAYQTMAAAAARRLTGAGDADDAPG